MLAMHARSPCTLLATGTSVKSGIVCWLPATSLSCVKKTECAVKHEGKFFSLPAATTFDVLGLFLKFQRIQNLEAFKNIFCCHNQPKV